MWAHDPAWSPDGTTLAFTLSQPDPDPNQPWLASSSICGLDRRTGKGRLLARAPGAHDALDAAAWTTDGQALLVSWHQVQIDATDQFTGERIMIARADLRTGMLQPVVPDADGAALSPDGQRLAYLHRDPQTGAVSLELRRIADGQTWPVQEPAEPFSTIVGPRWAPDGRSLVFTASGGTLSHTAPHSPVRVGLERLLGIDTAAAHGQPAYLWQVQADGTGVRRLTEAMDDPRAAWSPDGQQLAYSAGGAGGIYLLDPRTGRSRRLSDKGDYGGIAWAWHER
jgi:Tol biopolymer transport system component